MVIEKQLGIPEIRRLWEALPEARIAGGAVRDMLLERPVADVDFATPLSPEATLRRLADANIKTIPTGLAHGTITAIIGRRAFEITSLRRDPPIGHGGDVAVGHRRVGRPHRVVTRAHAPRCR